MGQISHPTMGSPHAMVTSNAELVITGSVNSYGPQGFLYAQDKLTNATITIEYEHHEIHGGKHFQVKGFQALTSSGDELCFGVTTPNGSTWAHMTFSIEGTTQTEIYEYEGATLSGGTPDIPINNNRNSSNASSLVITTNPVISGTSPTSGLLISSYSKGLAGATPAKASVLGEGSRNDEIVLKSGTTYLYCMKTAGANNIIDYNATWYEHTDKTQVF